MGKQMSNLEDVQAFFDKLRDEILSDRLFELGENQEIVESIKGDFDNIQQLLDEQDTYYGSKPFKDRSSYYEAKRVTHEIQNFLEEVRQSGVGDVHKTKRLIEYVRVLESIFGMLLIRPASSTRLETKLEPDYLSKSTNPRVASVYGSNSVSREQKQVAKPRRRGLYDFMVKFNTNTITPLGILFFDIIGRKPMSPSSSLIVGWTLFISILSILTLGLAFVILFINGTVQIEQVIKLWQLFFPPKAP